MGVLYGSSYVYISEISYHVVGIKFINLQKRLKIYTWVLSSTKYACLFVCLFVSDMTPFTDAVI